MRVLRVVVGHLTLVAVAAVGLSSAIAQPSFPAIGDRDAAYAASTPGFAFHSDFWLNLHDYLYGIAGGGDERRGFGVEGEACFSSVSEELTAGWRAAEAFYREQMGERHHRRDPLMHAIRHTLADIPLEDTDPDLSTVLDLLRNAAPAYRTCLWDMHDARNRRRIGELVGLQVLFGPALRDELSKYYQEPWPSVVTLDVVSYSDYAGANTSSLAHTMMSSTQLSTAGFSGLELINHEASHLMFGRRRGTIAEELQAASDALGVEPPNQLWHALSFYTSGEVVARIARAAGDEDYEPYAKRKGLFGTAFRGYLESIERHWQPYLDGETDISTAMHELVAEISAEED